MALTLHNTPTETFLIDDAEHKVYVFVRSSDSFVVCPLVDKTTPSLLIEAEAQAEKDLSTVDAAR